ncbi:MAG: nitroreductase [Chloroflexi bacterium]|nr:MAG: nitroreductase [Chloroflexota bacterium]MBL1194020.1 nitroreductase [Chloroflexota bacterium]NOH11314.1 nitroreductase family protein [Chloroflexota bacterium]
MPKAADNQHPIHELIELRWSPRAFADKPVSHENLLSLFEAARWAPSSRNEQPWVFIVATKDHPNEYQQLLDLLSEGNSRWAKDAPVLILAIAKTFFDYKHRDNAHARHDLGMAISNLLTQAVSMNLYAHPMAGFSRQKAYEAFNIPEDYDPVTMLALGYLGTPDQLDEDLAERETAPRQRKALNEFVYFGDWERSHPWIDS